jgi:3-keto-disaccharide hydrolase
LDMRRASNALLWTALVVLAVVSDASAAGRRRGRCCQEPSATQSSAVAPGPPATSPSSGPPNTTAKSPSDAAPPDVAQSAAAKPAVWTSLFDGKSLGKWKVTEFGTQGHVEVKDGQIVLGFGDGCTGVTWTADFPKVNYEISLQAMRVDGHDFFCGLTFPVDDSPCTFIVGGWGGGVVGLSSIDGEDASSNDTTKFMSFDSGRWYTIRVRVTKGRISTWIDKDQIVDQPLEGRKLSIRSEVDLSKPLGIASWKTTAALRDIRWRPLAEDQRQ